MLLFAGLAEELGCSKLVLEGPALPTSVGELSARLGQEWPTLATRPFRVAVNRNYVDDGHPVRAADELALIPPVSGG